MARETIPNKLELLVGSSSCFSFSKKDVLLLLCFYNVVYFICWLFLKNDFKVCFLTAFLVSLITLSVFVSVHLFRRLIEEENHGHKWQVELLKKIREEYSKAYKTRRIKELMHRIENLNEDKKTDPISNVADADSKDDPCKLNEVHFSYLNRYGTSRLHDLEERS